MILEIVGSLHRPKVVGRERVGTVVATHYYGQVDVRKAAATWSGPARAQARESVRATGLATFPVNVWIGDDGYVRRLDVVYARDKPDVTHTPWARAEYHGELDDFGMAVRIDLPAPASTVDNAALPPTS